MNDLGVQAPVGWSKYITNGVWNLDFLYGFWMLLFCSSLEILIFWMVPKIQYSNYLNTKHLKFKHLTFRTVLSSFKWSDHMIKRTIQKPDIFDQNQIFLSDFQTNIWIPDHLTTGHIWTIRIPDFSGIQMVTVFLNDVKQPQISNLFWFRSNLL